jgi:hypothetical protein
LKPKSTPAIRDGSGWPIRGHHGPQFLGCGVTGGLTALPAHHLDRVASVDVDVRCSVSSRTGGDRPRPSPSIARRQRSGSGVEVAATGVRGLHVERASIIWDALRVGTGRAPPRTRVGAHGLRRATLAAAFADGHPLLRRHTFTAPTTKKHWNPGQQFC